MQAPEHGERAGKANTRQEARLRKLEEGVVATLKGIIELLGALTKTGKTVTAIATEQRSIAKTLRNQNQEEQLGSMDKQREELGDTLGAILELNRTMNDMHESTRGDLVNLIRATTPKTPPRGSTGQICKRWQRFSPASGDPQWSQNRDGGPHHPSSSRMTRNQSSPEPNQSLKW